MADVTPATNTYTIVYADNRKLVFSYFFFIRGGGFRGQEASFADGESFSLFTDLATFNAELNKVGQPSLALDPFTTNPVFPYV